MQHVHTPGDPGVVPVQSEYGDIYKVSLTYAEKTVSEVKVKYFDTLPPCISICVLKTGFLFAASEFGNHALYQFAVCLRVWCCDDAHVRARVLSVLRSNYPYPAGDLPCGWHNADSCPACPNQCPCMNLFAHHCCCCAEHGVMHGTCMTSTWLRQGIGDDADVESSSAATVQTEEGYQPVFFDPRPLKNLLLIDEMESLSPIMDLKARPQALSLPKRDLTPVAAHNVTCCLTSQA